jgi:hypothetical protein
MFDGLYHPFVLWGYDVKTINVALASYPEKWLVESNPHPFINPVKTKTLVQPLSLLGTET